MNKSYFAIITADVRYNKNLTANHKLLFAEITALTNDKGFCWASNKYFAKAFNVSPRTIQRWLKSLAEFNFIEVYVRKNEQQQVVERVIKLPSASATPHDKNVTTPHDKFVTTPHDKNVAYNNISNNKRKNYKKEIEIHSHNLSDEDISRIFEKLENAEF